MKLGVSMCAVALLSIVSAENAFAQANGVSFVSSQGDDANTCTASAPCRYIQAAMGKTQASGEIRCVNATFYGALFITKEITITCDQGHAMLGGNNNSTVVEIQAGPEDDIVLRGLYTFGGETFTGNTGVLFKSGASLRIENSVIQGNKPNHGVTFAPSSGVPELYVSNSIISTNGSGTSGGGIQIAPTGSAGARVHIDGTKMLNNVVGVRADASGTTGAIDIVVSDSVVSGGAYHGLVAIGGSGRVRMMLDGVVSSNNGAEGIRVVHPNANVRIGRSTVSYNGTGIATTSGGLIRSYGDNFINGNNSDGVVPPIDRQK